MQTLVIGLLNVFLRPVIILLTLPVTMLTLGLFTLVINGLMFYLAAHLVSGFHVTGFGAAFVAALLFSLFSFVLNMVFRNKAVTPLRLHDFPQRLPDLSSTPGSA